MEIDFSTPKTVYLISPEPWGDNMISKHHYALLLASKGHQVYYFNPPTDQFALRSINDNLTVVSYKKLGGLNRIPSAFRSILQKWQFNKLRRKLSISNPDLVWSFDPFVFQNLHVFGGKALKIYHSVDDHSTHLEAQIAKSADIVFAISDLILRKFDTIDKPKYFINHGLANHFVEKTPKSNARNNQKLRIGYVGNLNHPFMDYPKLLNLVEENQGIQFTFIGPYQTANLTRKVLFHDEITRLKSSPNVDLLGSVPSHELPNLIDQFDAFLLCYHSTRNKTYTSNSHKLLEFLSTGKPIVSHYIDQYKGSAAKEGLILMEDDKHSLREKFHELITDFEKYQNAELALQRIELAKANTYENQWQRIVDYCKTLPNGN